MSWPKDSRALSPVMIFLAFRATAHSMNLSSSGSPSMRFRSGVFFENKIWMPLAKKAYTSSSSTSPFKPSRWRTWMYSSRMLSERQRMIFPVFQRSIISFGFPAKKEETKINVFADSFCLLVVCALTWLWTLNPVWRQRSDMPLSY